MLTLNCDTFSNRRVENINRSLLMTNNHFDSRGYDLDYYNLFLRRYLSEHRFPEAEDDLFIATRTEHAYDVFVESRLAGDEWYISNEKAMAAPTSRFFWHVPSWLYPIRTLDSFPVMPMRKWLLTCSLCSII